MERIFNSIILFIIISVAISLTTFAQEDKTVTLVVNGQGKTTDNAKQSALRNAIEQAFGTFISSKTDILNDELIKDEIVSVSNGNIQKYEILSEGQVPDGSFYSTLKATVSVSKLTSFCESKGINVEFKGALFSFNIKQQLLNEENELKAIRDMSFIIRKVIDKSFDFKIDVSQPTSVNGKNDLWKVPIKIGVSANNNFFQIPKILSRTLSGLSLSKKEAENYANLEKPFYTILMATPGIDDGQAYFLRNKESIKNLYDLIMYFRNPILLLTISNGINSFSIMNIANSIKLDDIAFRPFLFLGNGPGANNTSGFYLRSVFQRRISEDRPQYYKGVMVENSRRTFNDKRYRYVKDIIDDLEFYGYEFNKSRKLGELTPIYVVMSFLNIEKNDFGLIKINFYDMRTLKEINEITEYKIIPDSNEPVKKIDQQTNSNKPLKFNQKEFIENPDKLPVMENPLEFQRNINLQIPEILKRAGIYEKVEALVFINEQGNVEDIQILKKSSFPVCAEIAKTVLMETKFQAGFLKGVPVKVKMKIPVEFKF